jgi:pimeloyl-ACP methyl ester carboxylesterase
MKDIEIRSGLAPCGSIQIAYEDWGDETHPPLLLIMGIGAQMLLWPDDFCQRLVESGFRVIRFDNRDVGLSSQTREKRRQPLGWLMLRAQLGWQTPVPYTLADMAHDAVQLLDHLRIPKAHVLGGSMGGMIAQILAADYPQRVISLIILFSSTNQPLLPPPAPALLRQLLRSIPADATPDEQRKQLKQRLRALGSARYPVDEAELDTLAIRILQRGGDAEGIERQLSALLGSGDLRRYSQRIVAPTLVIHGSADRMVRKAGGVAVARAIANATLHIIPQMGHDLPPALRPLLVKLITEHVNNFHHTGTIGEMGT